VIDLSGALRGAAAATTMAKPTRQRVPGAVDQAGQPDLYLIEHRVGVLALAISGPLVLGRFPFGTGPVHRIAVVAYMLHGPATDSGHDTIIMTATVLSVVRHRISMTRGFCPA